MTRLANEKILTVENLLQSLTDEMLKLKSATKNYEETRENLQDVCKSVDRISATHQKLTNNMTEFLAEIKKMNYREQTDKILQQGETQSKVLGDLIAKQTDRILQNHENQSKALGDGLMKQTDKILQYNENQSKALRLTRFLVLLGVVLETVALVLILLF